MSAIRITHLTMVGTNVPDASVSFAERLSLIHGPSDTGKSFIVDAIDFVLGASSIKEIPEREGYDTVLLGITLTNGEPYTLGRPIRGGRIGVYEREIRTRPDGVPDFTLATKHNAATEDNISRFLLGEIGLDDRRVRKNIRNETTSLSFRDLAHLAIVDETDMQSEVSPAVTGSHTGRTREISVLKLLLQGDDDSGLQPIESSSERTRVRTAKAEVVESLISELDESLRDVPEKSELLDQLARLNVAIDRGSAATGEVASQRQSLIAQISAAQNKQQNIRDQFGHAGELAARLNLLKTQYDSDLSRLEMIAEAGNLLGFFRSGVCPFCGADVEHQANHQTAHDPASFQQAVASEIYKTTALRGDLDLTLTDLGAEREDLQASFTGGRVTLDGLRAQLNALDARLAPHRDELRDLLDVKVGIDRALGLYDQLAAHQSRLTAIMTETATEAAAAVEALSLRAIDELSLVMQTFLASWGYAESKSVRYDRKEQDVVAGGQLRAAHGKGVRAILHAAFTLGLATYCVERGLPHPGFVVLDSPLVTYRPPEPGESAADADSGLAPDLASRFYASLEGSLDVQVIVLENTDPAAGLGVDTIDTLFTKSTSGRYGFFPARSADEDSK